MKKLAGIHMLMGLLGLPRAKLYWSRISAVPLVTETMTRDRFSELRGMLHFVDLSQTTDAQTENKLFRAEPIIESFRKACLELPRPKAVSVDEQMIPFSGRCPARQYVPSKPNPVGLKNFVLSSSDGLLLDFVIYTAAICGIEFCVLSAMALPSVPSREPGGVKKRGKNTTLTMEKKAAIIKLIESGRSQLDVAKEYHLSKQTVFDYVKNRIMILTAFENSHNKSQKNDNFSSDDDTPAAQGLQASTSACRATRAAATEGVRARCRLVTNSRLRRHHHDPPVHRERDQGPNAASRPHRLTAATTETWQPGPARMEATLRCLTSPRGPGAGRKGPELGSPPAHLYRPFQGRTVEDADRRANGACLPVPAGTRFCECGAVVIHNSHELGKLHRHRTQATQPSSRESSQERSGAAVRAMLARAAQEADFAQWLLRVASGHASSESPPAPLSITATVERGAAGPGETLVAAALTPEVASMTLEAEWVTYVRDRMLAVTVALPAAASGGVIEQDGDHRKREPPGGQRQSSMRRLTKNEVGRKKNKSNKQSDQHKRTIH
ncbi:hypothetical protein MRX96_005947 [Rhipicephalus microplus]